MQVVFERCSGLDVHKKTVVACTITHGRRETRTFATATEDLLSLGDWLVGLGVTHVAMEATGVYWKPIYNVLEAYGFTILVVNAQHIKAVPGRKTDVKDAEWIADLLRHGLLRGSFIPNREQRELQELIRYRKSLIRERATEVTRVQKVLEGANIKLASVASDVLGASGRAMLKAMVAGETDPKKLVSLAKGKLQHKKEQLERALRGVVGEHQRKLLGFQMEHIEFLEQQIEAASVEIAAQMHAYEQAVGQAVSIPGMGQRNAEMILAHIGLDMSRFPSAGHIASWSGLCPGNHESAGKRSSGRTRKGNPWLREALVEAAWAAAKTKNTYLSALYHRIAARRGAKRAIVAVAHAILVIIYHLLKDGTTYQELGPNYFDEQAKAAILRKTVRRLENLGFKVTVQPVA